MAIFGKKKTEKVPRPTAGILVREADLGKKAAEIKAEEGAVAMPKGEDEHAYGIILAPYITEKGSLMSSLNKYVFKVADGANKIDIKKSVEKLYKVSIVKVHILKARARQRMIGKYEGHKPGFKKAIVTLKEGSKIDLAA
jgi:large subunit ribosomal protein L23